MRYDLKLDFKRMETVKAEKGYQGPVVVCAIYFTPIAGYIPDRPVIKYLAAQRNIEIAFAPIAGTRILVPFRMVIPTPLGPAMLEATQFITRPRRRGWPRRSECFVPRTQASSSWPRSAVRASRRAGLPVAHRFETALSASLAMSDRASRVAARRKTTSGIPVDSSSLLIRLRLSQL